MFHADACEGRYEFLGLVVYGWDDGVDAHGNGDVCFGEVLGGSYALAG